MVMSVEDHTRQGSDLANLFTQVPNTQATVNKESALLADDQVHIDSRYADAWLDDSKGF
jgi:hypothetical protein